MTSGVLLVDKPAGWRSRQLVDALSRAAGIRKVGHAGTLDPMATGLMVILFNEGTKLSRFLMDGRKTYRATIVLGRETDTYDADGETIAEHPIQELDDAAIQRALGNFRGDVMQVPPPIAAVKVNGKAAYKYAREGKPVELEPRPVTIYSLQVLRIALPDVEIEVSCSKGTYIRAIAHDLGKALGVGGHLGAIRRIESSPFHVRDAHPFEPLLDLPAEAVRERLVPVEAALPGFHQIEAGGELARCILNGNKIRGELVFGRIPPRMKKGEHVVIVAPGRMAITTLEQDAADMGPPPWTGRIPLRYERILHRGEPG